MADYPNRRPDRERHIPNNPIDQPEREPFREPKRPLDPNIDREEQQPDKRERR